MPTIRANVELHEIASSDLEELVRFISRASGSNTPLADAVKRQSWILLENPAREPDDPLGWLLRSASGEIVGCMCCAPQKFCCGETTMRLMMSNSFYVDEQYHGAGISIFLKYLQLGSRYPLFASSTNAIAAEMWGKLGAYQLGNSGHEVFGVLHWPPLLAEALYRRTANDKLASFAAAAASLVVHSRLISGTVAARLLPLTDPGEAASLCAQYSTGKITSCRDANFLKWRYFSWVHEGIRTFAFLSSEAEKTKYMVAVRVQHRGYRQQIRALQVLDIWPEPGPKLCLEIAAALSREYRDRIDMLVFRCLDAAQRQALTESGFRVRPFPRPIAWCIDKHALLRAKEWYFVPADGDMFL